MFGVWNFGFQKFHTCEIEYLGSKTKFTKIKKSVLYCLHIIDVSNSLKYYLIKKHKKKRLQLRWFKQEYTTNK